MVVHPAARRVGHELRHGRDVEQVVDERPSSASGAIGLWLAASPSHVVVLTRTSQLPAGGGSSPVGAVGERGDFARRFGPPRADGHRGAQVGKRDGDGSRRAARAEDRRAQAGGWSSG